jgi:hypothetical protein
MASSPPSPTEPLRDRDAIPWLLVAAAAAILAVVAGVAEIGQSGSYWWVVAVIALVCAAAAGGGAGVIHLTNRRRRRPQREVPGGTADGPAPDWTGPQGSPHVLVVASEPVDRSLLADGLRHSVPPGVAVLVVAPALTTNRLRDWVSDTDAAIARARAVEEASVAALRDAGIAADGHVGSGDPLTAIEDALRFFDPEVIVLYFHRSGRRGYREPPLRTEVERRFSRPVAEIDPPRRLIRPRPAAGRRAA